MKGVFFHLSILYFENKNLMNKLPDLHKQAFTYKNHKKFQHDGGRAWIKDSQLYEARRNANGKLITITKKKS